MNADTIAAIQAARLEFQGLLGKPFTFGDSPSINAPAAAASEAPEAPVVVETGRTVCQNVMLPAGSSQTPAAAAKRTPRARRPRVSPDETGQQGSWDGF